MGNWIYSASDKFINGRITIIEFLLQIYGYTLFFRTKCWQQLAANSLNQLFIYLFVLQCRISPGTVRITWRIGFRGPKKTRFLRVLAMNMKPTAPCTHGDHLQKFFLRFFFCRNFVFKHRVIHSVSWLVAIPSAVLFVAQCLTSRNKTKVSNVQSQSVVLFLFTIWVKCDVYCAIGVRLSKIEWIKWNCGKDLDTGFGMEVLSPDVKGRIFQIFPLYELGLLDWINVG